MLAQVLADGGDERARPRSASCAPTARCAGSSRSRRSTPVSGLIYSVVHDVTDREEAFMDRLAGAFRDAALGMALVAPGGAFLRVNSTLCRLLGHTEQELLAESLSDVVDDARVAQALRAGGALAADRGADAPPRGAPRGGAREPDARARLARRARVLRLPGARHDRALPGAGRPGRQRGQAGRGPADRADGLLGVGDRLRPRHLVRRALPHLRRDARRRDRAPTGPTSTRSTPTTAPASGASSRRR